jgi:phage shock protein E
MDGSWLNNLILALAITLLLYTLRKRLSGPAVDLGELAAALGADALLLDVRSPGEFASGHLKGARNIPVGDLPRRLRDVGSKGRTVLVYCASGSRSGSARRLLEREGYRVIDLGSQRHAERAIQAARSGGASLQAAPD